MKKEFMRRVGKKILVICLHERRRKKGEEAGRARALIP